MKTRRNVLREIRAQQRDPYRRRPLKPTARFSNDIRQLSLASLVPSPPAIPIPSSETPPEMEEQLDLEDFLASLPRGDDDGAADA
jgi:hypothetical protein